MGSIGTISQTAAQPTAAQIGDLEQLRATGLRFDDKNGIPPDQWLDNAERRDASPEWKAQYKELVDIAGGRTDRPSLLRAIEVAQAYLTATASGASASDHQAFVRTLADNLTFQLGRLDPAALLTSPLQGAARLVLEQSGARDTEWGRSLDRALGQSVAFNAGLAEGVWQGGTEMVTGIATMAGRALQFGADNSLLGQAGDAVRGLTGRLPGWLETWTPSAARGAASSKALGQTMKNAVDYIASNSPAEVAGDIRDAIAAQWDSLRASHAAASAQGPEAEARWWGQTVGRVGFEVAATFVPGLGVAGKVSKGARTADALTDGARAADTLVDAARVANGASDAAAAVRTANRVENTGDAARAADAPTAAANPAGPAALRLVRETFGKNAAEWTVDAQGRLLSARATLREVFSDLPRSRAERDAQTAAAEKGIAGDHGGHAIPHRFLGDQGEINLFPQNGVPDGALKNFNGSAFKTLENELADWVQAGGKVDYEVSFKNFDGDRPGSVEIRYKVFDKNGNEVYRNRDAFQNEAGQTFNRVTKGFIESRLNGGS